jgi:tetratricopeptide (TPR) repeat protein
MVRPPQVGWPAAPAARAPQAGEPCSWRSAPPGIVACSPRDGAFGGIASGSWTLPSHPADSITRKLFALIAGCHSRLGRHEDALAACREGRRFYPEDAELLYREGVLREEAGDWAGAESCWRRLVDRREGPHFASMGAGLRGYLGRPRLALACLRRGAWAEAEAQWRAALAERPDLAEAWQGLQELERRRGQPGEAMAGAGAVPSGLAFSLTTDVPAVTFDPGNPEGAPRGSTPPT